MADEWDLASSIPLVFDLLQVQPSQLIHHFLSHKWLLAHAARAWTKVSQWVVTLAELMSGEMLKATVGDWHLIMSCKSQVREDHPFRWSVTENSLFTIEGWGCSVFPSVLKKKHLFSLPTVTGALSCYIEGKKPLFFLLFSLFSNVASIVLWWYLIIEATRSFFYTSSALIYSTGICPWAAEGKSICKHSSSGGKHDE